MPTQSDLLTAAAIAAFILGLIVLGIAVSMVTAIEWMR
jgi:hypothetical protein